MTVVPVFDTGRNYLRKRATQAEVEQAEIPDDQPGQGQNTESGRPKRRDKARNRKKRCD